MTRREALELLPTGAVDPRRTALLEALARPSDARQDRVRTARYEPDRIRVIAATDAPGLLVFSEAAYPPWRAYLDGEEVALYTADHLFRAVSLPPGEHTVELRYESRSLGLGIGISPGSLRLLGALAALAVWRRWKLTRPDRLKLPLSLP